MVLRQDVVALRHLDNDMREVQTGGGVVIILLGEGNQGVDHRDEIVEKEVELAPPQESAEQEEKMAAGPRKAVGKGADGAIENHVIRSTPVNLEEGLVRRASGTAGGTVIAARMMMKENKECLNPRGVMST